MSKNCSNCINTPWFDECTEQADMSNMGVGCLFWKGEQKMKYAPIPKEETDCASPGIPCELCQRCG